jgi:hypothetical protein
MILYTVLYTSIVIGAFFIGRELGKLQSEDRIQALERDLTWWKDIANRLRKENPLPPWPPGSKEKPWPKMNDFTT